MYFKWDSAACASMTSSRSRLQQQRGAIKWSLGWWADCLFWTFRNKWIKPEKNRGQVFQRADFRAIFKTERSANRTRPHLVQPESEDELLCAFCFFSMWVFAGPPAIYIYIMYICTTLADRLCLDIMKGSKAASWMLQFWVLLLISPVVCTRCMASSSQKVDAALRGGGLPCRIRLDSIRHSLENKHERGGNGAGGMPAGLMKWFHDTSGGMLKGVRSMRPYTAIKFIAPWRGLFIAHSIMLSFCSIFVSVGGSLFIISLRRGGKKSFNGRFGGLAARTISVWMFKEHFSVASFCRLHEWLSVIADFSVSFGGGLKKIIIVSEMHIS